MSVLRRSSIILGTIALCGASSVQAHAQRFGITVGATFSNIHGADDLQLEQRTGTTVGASLQMPVGPHLAIQPELLFVNKGASFRRQPTTGARQGGIKLDYIEIPVLLRYDFARTLLGPHLYIGPSASFNVGCTLFDFNNSTGKSDCKSNDFKPRSLDYGLSLGGGVDLNLGGTSLTGGARYGIGLADIRSDNSQEFHDRVSNGVLSLYLGVNFGRLNK